MTRSRLSRPFPSDPEEEPRSLYDPEPGEEEDLWFFPPEPDDEDPFALPGPRADRRSLLDAGEWLRAEAKLAVPLARAAAELARLDALTGPGMAERLALLEAEAMVVAEGGRIRREDLGRDLMGAETDPDRHGDLARGRWASRRLAARPAAPSDLRAFLGLHETRSAPEDPAFAETLRPRGAAFAEAEEAFRTAVARVTAAHPITRAAFAYRAWQLAGLSAPGSVAEPATSAARIAAEENRNLGFAPLSGTREVWIGGGTAEARLSRWIDGVRSGALAAQMTVHRVEDWALSAGERVSSWKGGTPGKIVAVLRDHPLLGTEAVATYSGISRDSAERALSRMLAAGLIRELTGRGRFRLWSAAT